MIVYLDIMKKLEQAGWSAYRLRQEKLLSESTMSRLRNNEPVSTPTLDVICRLCSCQPGELLAWVPDEKAGE